MKEIINHYAQNLKDTSGVEAILKEMENQKKDAISSYENQKDQIKKLASEIKTSNRIVLLGMGASHFVNKVFAFQLCKLGYEALAITASDFLYSQIKIKSALFIYTSQSGESIETVKCLELSKDQKHFSFTLDGNSTIAKNTIPIVADGGIEKAYAGTRSVIITIALMAYVISELGAFEVQDVFNSISYKQNYNNDFKKAIEHLWSGNLLVSTGRGIAYPLSSLFSLGCQELSCLPFLNYETGQFRHGPKEMIKKDSVIVIFRQSGELGKLAQSFEEIAKQTGCHLIVIDFSGLEPLKGATTIWSKVGDGILAVLSAMETFQVLMICYSCGKNPMTGIPRFSSKITTTE